MWIKMSLTLDHADLRFTVKLPRDEIQFSLIKILFVCEILSIYMLYGALSELSVQ